MDYGTESGRHAGTTLTDAIQLWPAPRAEHDSGKHRGQPDTLHSATKQWATPTSHDGRRPGSDAASTQGANLKRDAETWPTPQAYARASTDYSAPGFTPLDGAAGQWATPTSRDADKWHYREPGHERQVNLSGQASAHSLPAPETPMPGDESSPSGPTSRRRLNPKFVEWLMGVPEGWVTDVDGLSRADMLRLLGNGVVPAQGALALGLLMEEAS